MKTDTSRDGRPTAEPNKESDKSNDFVPNQADIARKAYFRHLNGDSGQQDPLTDWLMAEKELISYHSDQSAHKHHN